MTEKNKFEKGNSSLSNHKMKKGTSKNSWKHQMYELEIAIAKESSNKKRNELIKIRSFPFHSQSFSKLPYCSVRFDR